jgi:PAS domain S-box-containing protein
MTSNYAYIPQIWPPVLMVVLMIALSVFSLRRRSAPGALQLMGACLCAAAWAASLLMNYAAVDTATKILWLKVQSIVQLPIIIVITCFILEYAWPQRWLTRRNLALLYFPVLLSGILLLTNDLHHQIWRGYSLVNGALRPQFGIGSWILSFYFFGVPEALNLIVFGWLFRRSPQHRWPVTLMLVGQIVGRTLFLSYNAIPLISVLPYNLMGMSFEFLIYALALFGFRIFDPIPLARQTTIEQLKSGMLVLNPQGVIIGLNPAAAAILGSSEKRLKGHLIQNLLPALAHLPGELQASVAGQAEISLEVGPETRFYQLEISPLKDWRGLGIGRLLLLSDVTEQKKAQAQIVEQQRALAMLHEREQLARELHDSTGQVLGYAGFQLEVVHDRIQEGQAAASAGQIADVHNHLAEAENQLTRLSSVVEEAHADVREYILNLRLAPSDQRPFFATIRHYLDGFSQNYGIQTEFSISPRVDEEKINPGTQMQLFRIIQEALSNARKHAGASCVQVFFEMQDGTVRIHIQDNGRGFDPTQAACKGESHFGLRFMLERAGQLGGSLQVNSAPGEGTCVIVEVPID